MPCTGFRVTFSLSGISSLSVLDSWPAERTLTKKHHLPDDAIYCRSSSCSTGNLIQHISHRALACEGLIDTAGRPRNHRMLSLQPSSSSLARTPLPHGRVEIAVGTARSAMLLCVIREAERSLAALGHNRRRTDRQQCIFTVTQANAAITIGSRRSTR